MLLSFLILVVLMATSGERHVRCLDETSPTDSTTQLYVLTMLPSVDKGAYTGARLARNDVNRRAYLLPGYNIQLILRTRENCSTMEQGLGMSNFVEVFVGSQCRPVLAVIGLDCSCYTEFFSSVAGRFDVLHFSVANSPIFKTQSYRFSHLWRFAGSVAVYSDAVIAIMDQYSWNKIGIIHSTSNYDLAKHTINALGNKSVEFDVGIREIPLNQIIQIIKEKRVTILVLLLNLKQDMALLQLLNSEGLAHPHYTYIYLETLPEDLLREGNFSCRDNIVRGHIFLQVQFNLRNNTQLVSGENYKAFLERYESELQKVYGRQNLTEDLISGRFLYDQIWALALAVNRSIPVLVRRNLSIDNYTIGQPITKVISKSSDWIEISHVPGVSGITGVIEEELENLRFQGASGWVEFNQHRGVTATHPVDVFWVWNGTSRLVGTYNPLNSSNFQLNISSSLLPGDVLPTEGSFFRVIFAILLYIITTLLVIITSMQFVLYFYYRKEKIIKATSPYVSICLFFGCYLICLSAFLNITIFYENNNPSHISPKLLAADITFYNGINLILITTFMKELRLYRIFFSKLQKDIGPCWGRVPLVTLILCLTIIPNICIIVVVSFLLTQDSDKVYIFDTAGSGSQTTITYLVFIGFIAVYLTSFISLISIFAIFNSKIRNQNFNDAPKNKLFIVALFIFLFVMISLFSALNVIDELQLASIVVAISNILVGISTQLILIFPKILHTILAKNFSSCQIT